MTEKNELLRVECFSDAVFAIAATLLVLEIKVPSLAGGLSFAQVWKEIGSLWPSYMAFLLSFGTILVIWVNHHFTVQLLHKISRSFLYANGLLLLTITFFPYPTAMLAKYIDTPYASEGVVFYSLACLLINLAFLIWWLAMRKPVYLIRPEISKAQIKKILTQLLSGLCIYICTTVISFWFATIGIVVIIVLNILWITMSILERKVEKA